MLPAVEGLRSGKLFFFNGPFADGRYSRNSGFVVQDLGFGGLEGWGYLRVCGSRCKVCGHDVRFADEG